MPQLPDTSAYTNFRIAEKHFKNRSEPGHLPSLRTYDVVDLSRPDKLEDDEVWKAGWWGEMKGRYRKGKERARGERPQMDRYDQFQMIECGQGRMGYVIAEGMQNAI